ncbi:hypothetical protein RSSM_05115 [Rhodopirellula sallentina SM41]|uniref:Uncharacterized protein n=1 Tax=Rhodopirellula sallentina SM41 TaxID=1263870 RepID=M5U6F8_9BACT|nr:hypothetical protein RSSM_05115 [Rhodopirellula sallentina SM41]
MLLNKISEALMTPQVEAEEDSTKKPFNRRLSRRGIIIQATREEHSVSTHMTYAVP